MAGLFEKSNYSTVKRHLFGLNCICKSGSLAIIISVTDITENWTIFTAFTCFSTSPAQSHYSPEEEILKRILKNKKS